MKEIKTSPNVEMDVIYADGTRRRAVITPGVINLVKRTAVMMPHLFEGTGFNPLDADVANIVAITRTDHDILHRTDDARRQAIFRLGQMDMQQATADLLLNLAGNTKGISRSTLLDAVEHVCQMEVLK